MKYLKQILSVFLVIAILIGMTPITKALTSEEIEDQIEQLKQEKEQLKEDLVNLQVEKEQNQDDIEKLMAEKAIIDQEIQILSQDIENNNQQIMYYNMLIADKQDELETATQRLDDLNQKYKERIRAMEESGRISYWSVLFKANSFADLLDRLHMIEEIAAADNRKLQELNAAAVEVETAKADLMEEKQKLEDVKTELDKTQEELNKKKETSDKLLQELITKAYDLEKLELSFEEMEKDFLEEIAQMEVEYTEAKQREWEEYLQSLIPPEPEQKPEEKPSEPETPKEETHPKEEPKEEPEEQKPVFDNSKWYKPCSYVKLTSPFGYRDAPTAGASTYHQGVDLAGPAGTPIYATRGGQVIFAGYGSAAGNYVQIDHLDGYRSVYMHMTNYVLPMYPISSPGATYCPLSTT